MNHLITVLIILSMIHLPYFVGRKGLKNEFIDPSEKTLIYWIYGFCWILIISAIITFYMVVYSLIGID